MNQFPKNNVASSALWLRVVLTLFCFILIVVYWKNRGPLNFLWFTDIAFFMLIAAMWLNSSYLLSMAAVSALLFETVWNIDFFYRLIVGSHLFGMDATAYMFDMDHSTIMKTLSLVLHVGLPFMTVCMLFRLGYHPGAWKAQLGVLALLLPVCYLVTDPERNVNWVFGIGGVQSYMPGWQYVVLEFICIAVLVYLPSHLLLRKIFFINRKIVPR